MRTNKDKKLIVGYVRSAVEDNLSIKEQEKQIREYCLKNGYELSKVFIDNGCSGANPNRPALQELLIEAVKGNMSKVICLGLDRLSRNPLDYVFIESQLKKYGVEIVTTTGVSTSDVSAVSQTIDELMAVINSLQPRTHHDESKEQRISVDKQNRFKRLVKITVSEKDLNNMPKFNEVIKEEPLYASTCGLSRSQIVLIAKILRLNLENDTEVKAEIQF